MKVYGVGFFILLFFETLWKSFINLVFVKNYVFLKNRYTKLQKGVPIERFCFTFLFIPLPTAVEKVCGLNICL